MDDTIYAEFPGLSAHGYMNYGESAVWQCTNTLEFQELILPCTLLNNRGVTIHYLCFGQQPSYHLGTADVTTQYINAEESFESFIFQVYHSITSAPEKTLFLFDVLSDLQTSWMSDLMIANFFRIICPILAEQRSSGIFYIKRNSHSSYAIHNILNISSLYVDVQYKNGHIRLASLKHGDHSRQSVTYLSAENNGNTYQKSDPPEIEFAEGTSRSKVPDIWLRYFTAVRQLADAGTLSDTEREKICRRMMSQSELVGPLIMTHFTAKDYIAVHERMIGSGRIGGKACGFLLGRKLIEKYMQDTAFHLKTQDTFFIGTDVFYSYLVRNSCWPYRLEHRIAGEAFDKIKDYSQALLHGAFPSPIRRQLIRMLIHYDHHPIIVRSSSFMEDGYGNAFSGKYESVFCSNQGTLKECLLELEDAIRKVYASTLYPSALEYRRKRKLLDKDEQMALLIQKVSGERYGNYFFPVAAGVSFSYNPYRWMEHINPKAGMARLVAGMGTRAVSCTPGDYPRLVGLDRPQAQLYSTTRERHKYSQRHIDILNLTTRQIEPRSCQEILTLLPPKAQKLVFSHDTEAETLLQERGHYKPVYFADCQGIINHPEYVDHLKQILTTLQENYGCPVDIEFALSLNEQDSIDIDLLQCRPLKPKKGQVITVPPYEESEVLFHIKQASMSCSKEERIDTIVYITPEAYYNMPYASKPQIASIIGTINQQIEHKNALLLVPGRIGTTSPDLGIPVTYADVNQFQSICEVEYNNIGYAPELSYGSHMFQDLVEADVFYAAINANSNTIFYQPDLLTAYEDSYPDYASNAPTHAQIIHVYDLGNTPAKLYLDSDKGTALCILSNHPL